MDLRNCTCGHQPEACHDGRVFCGNCHTDGESWSPDDWDDHIADMTHGYDPENCRDCRNALRVHELCPTCVPPKEVAA